MGNNKDNNKKGFRLKDWILGFILGLMTDNIYFAYLSKIKPSDIWKFCVMAFGGVVGWVVAEFRPSFPLIIVAIIFILYDAYCAYKLDKRVHVRYPDKAKRHEAKFTSFAFGKVVHDTIPKRLMLIILAYICEHWVFIHVQIPLSYIVTGVICFEQFWSILENEASCRDEDSDSRFFRFLQRIMVDKTARHFDIDPSAIDELSGKREKKPKRKTDKPT